MNAPRLPARARRAFTLIELLTGIAIIGILAAIIIPTVGKVRETARMTQCASNQRQIAMAMLGYANDNKNFLPKGNSGASADNVNQAYSWSFEILPYLSRAVDPNNLLAQRKAVEVLTCPVFVSSRQPTDAQLEEGYFGIGLNLAMGVPDNFSTSVNWAARNAQWTRMNITRFANPARVVMIGDSDQTTSSSQRYQMLLSSGGDGGATIGANGGTRHGTRAAYAFVDGHTATMTPEQAQVVIRPN